MSFHIIMTSKLMYTRLGPIDKWNVSNSLDFSSHQMLQGFLEENKEIASCYKFLSSATVVQEFSVFIQKVVAM